MKYFSHRQNRNKNLRPPDLYEYFVDNFWFKAADLENQKINEPLRGSQNRMWSLLGVDLLDCQLPTISGKNFQTQKL